MNEQELFVEANETLQRIIAQIKDEQMDREIPDELSWRPNQKVRAAMNLYAYENACVPKVLNGEVTQTNDEFRGDLLGDDPQANYLELSSRANQAVSALDDPDRTVHISYGNFPARTYLRDITIQRGLGASDLAKFLGVDPRLSTDLVEGLWEIILPIADMMRDFGVFRAQVEVPENAPLQDRLFGLTGRQP